MSIKELDTPVIVMKVDDYNTLIHQQIDKYENIDCCLSKLKQLLTSNRTLHDFTDLPAEYHFLIVEKLIGEIQNISLQAMNDLIELQK